LKDINFLKSRNIKINDILGYYYKVIAHYSSDFILYGNRTRWKNENWNNDIWNMFLTYIENIETYSENDVLSYYLGK